MTVAADRPGVHHLRNVELRRDLAEILVAARTDEGEVAMALDEAGHQRLAAAVDRLGRGLGADLVPAQRHLGDPVAGDQNLAGIAIVAIAVPYLHVPEKV